MSGCWDSIISGVSKGQAVMPGMTGLLTSVDLFISDTGFETSPLTATIFSVSGGLPVGAPLASVTVPPSSLSVSDSWVNVAFSAPAAVTAGIPFAIVLSSAQDSSTGAYLWSSGTPPYSGGSALTDSGAGWTGTSSNYSFDFRTYVSQGGSSQSPPPVLQQFGRPAQGTCALAASSSLNWGGAAEGNWGESWAQWANGGAGGPVCTRTPVSDSDRGKLTSR